MCKEKQKEYLKKYYQKNRAKIKIRSHKNYLKTKDRISARGKIYRKTLHYKVIRLRKQYNISYEEANQWLKIKECEICGNMERLATDHDHKTGKIRGRLCWRCNRAMGAFQDSIKILSNAVNYLKK